jgi:hypothetical protein
MERAEPTQTFFLDTNITPIQKSMMQLASSFTFNPAQYPLVIGGTGKNNQPTIIKPTQTGINRNK